ncbi:endonuclease NucS [Synechococcus sp. CBW1107]|uniref:endonuclease NucS n=1 Tax=Synechococcus sp. CBW1107 TaxID=2789857 RepID=UPI002AD32382|nr:endonuclease NucS [Synechococcus sp. CBW1107]CAK6690109.1 hypothetical protein ICNINCKA_00742 [Synechococcus sp. CBW1107]
MPEQVRLWRVDAEGTLRELNQRSLDLESRLQDWLLQDITLLDPNLLVIGREVLTEHGGYIDLLCLNRLGDLVVVELKRDKTPRTVTAQALDYGSWVAGLSNERIRSLREEYLPHRKVDLDTEFCQHFGQGIPETLNNEHHLLVVGSEIDESSERIIRYLSEHHGVSINAVRFQYFKDQDGEEFVSRVFLIDPSLAEDQVSQRVSSKRQRNLTDAELTELAADRGVGALYTDAVKLLGSKLRHRSTRSSIGFLDTRSGKPKAVLNLLPAKSSPEEGIAYQLYGARFLDLCGTREETLTAALPSGRQDWSYEGGSASDPDWTGYCGFFKTIEELSRLADLLPMAMTDRG